MTVTTPGELLERGPIVDEPPRWSAVQASRALYPLAMRADAESTAVTMGILIPQPHGGALRRGGPIRGGPGRPRDAVRQLAVRGAARAVPRLIAIATDPTFEPKDVIAAARALQHRFVIGTGDRLQHRPMVRSHRAALTAGSPPPAPDEPAPASEDPAA